MSIDKNAEYVMNLDDNINNLLKEYRKHYSVFALLPVQYKINYAVIYLALISIVLSFVVIAEKVILGMIMCVISVVIFFCTNFIHVIYIKKNRSKIHNIRYQFLNAKLKRYNAFTLNCLNKRLQKRREKNNVNIISISIATFAVITLPIWETYVSVFFEENVIGTTSELQSKNFLILPESAKLHQKKMRRKAKRKPVKRLT